MLLEGYRNEFIRPECRPDAESVHVIAHLDQDIGEVLPYLNAALGGFQYTRDPPSVSFKLHGKLKVIEILKLLPRTNCKECGQPTCMVFATHVAEGGMGPDDCPPLSEEKRKKLEEYLGQFQLEW